VGWHGYGPGVGLRVSVRGSVSVGGGCVSVGGGGGTVGVSVGLGVALGITGVGLGVSVGVPVVDAVGEAGKVKVGSKVVVGLAVTERVAWSESVFVLVGCSGVPSPPPRLTSSKPRQ